MDQPTATISIDVEFFTHLPAYRNASGHTDAPDIGISALDGFLNVFYNYDINTTVFVVADIAERHPDVINRIAAAGHEIGSHTRHHHHLSELSTEQRWDELHNSREILEQVTGTSVTGFRAPSFDIGQRHFQELESAGYEYDSSVAPCRTIPGWYGGEYTGQSPCTTDQLKDGAPNTITEIPIAVMPGLRLPLTGTWIRFFGVRYTILGMRLLARQGIPPVLYVHPWEFAELPDVDGVPKRVYWHTGEWMWEALDTILSTEFEFITARSLVSRTNE
jgi:peptidoglycan/xylan/chitin deacetylase (PgdA/CDA1 family)